MFVYLPTLITHYFTNVLSRTFHLIMALIVTINAIALAFYNPVDGDDTRNAAVDIVCVICDIIFILEATMKVRT